MEELQDAIEDAQYVNAISSQDDGPRPVLPWKTATEEELALWKKQILNSDPQAFGIDWTLSSAIGLFLFSSFLKDDCNDYLRINFSEQVIRWKRLRGRHRIEKAKELIATYLKPPILGEEQEVILPRKMEIDEYDLERPVPQITTTEIATLYEVNYDESSTETCIGLKGSILQEINDIVAGLDKKTEENVDSPKRNSNTTESEANAKPAEEEKETDERHKHNEQASEKEDIYSSTKDDNESSGENTDHKFEALKKQLSAMNIDRRQSRARKYLPDSLFDKAEAIVIESLRRQYWGAFTESEYYKKMDNFHWYKDQPVVPEDFFILRVLGRGGFGLVTGEFDG
jgi:beta-adrenergic-receptor kinase